MLVAPASSFTCTIPGAEAGSPVAVGLVDVGSLGMAQGSLLPVGACTPRPALHLLNPPRIAPRRSLPFEDVMLGMLLMDAVEAPQDHQGEAGAGLSCCNPQKSPACCSKARVAALRRAAELPLPAASPAGFRAAWRSCSTATAVKHLDVDAPLLFRGLYEQDVSGGRFPACPACQPSVQ